MYIVFFDFPFQSNNNTMENQLRALLPGINISIDCKYMLCNVRDHGGLGFMAENITQKPAS